jgi:hypothetical protein
VDGDSVSVLRIRVGIQNRMKRLLIELWHFGAQFWIGYYRLDAHCTSVLLLKIP